MPAPLYPPSAPQTVAQVLDSTFRIFQASVIKCLPYGILSMIAGQLQNIYLLALGRPLHQFGRGDPVWWVLYVTGILLGLFIWGAMLLRQGSIASNTATDTRAEFLESFKRMPAVIGLFALIIVLLTAGLVALIVPALYLMIALTFSWLILLKERLGPVASAKRSVHLVKGSWWRTLIVLTVVTMAAFVFYLVAFSVLFAVLQIAGTNDFAMFTATSVVVLIALFGIGAPFYGAVLYALYGDLRLRREGIDLASRLSVAAPG